jgi:hypothetical protein
VAFRTPQTVVIIIVDLGANQQTFVIHKHLISHYSPFFKAEFDSNIEQGETKTMTMEDVDARIFGLFVHWLYTQTKRMSQLQSRPLIDWAKFYSLAIRF